MISASDSCFGCGVELPVDRFVWCDHCQSEAVMLERANERRQQALEDARIDAVASKAVTVASNTKTAAEKLEAEQRKRSEAQRERRKREREQKVEKKAKDDLIANRKRRDELVATTSEIGKQPRRNRYHRYWENNT